MVPLAALLTEAGHRVTGSDLDFYPPMSTLLESLQIPVFKGFSPEHVPADADAVIVGNAATRDNVEAAEAERRRLPVLSMPQAIRQYLLPGKTSVVITGTHGKTTTSALTAWLLFDCGRDPGFLVGGEIRNFGRGYRRGSGPHFVLEGDEYNAAFFDRGPKFLHYEPRHLFIGNIEYDHADLFPDLDAVLDAFRKVAAIVPADGVIVVNRGRSARARRHGGRRGAARARLDRGSRRRLRRGRHRVSPRGHRVHARRRRHADRAPHLAAARPPQRAQRARRDRARARPRTLAGRDRALAAALRRRAAAARGQGREERHHASSTTSRTIRRR